MWWMVQAWSLTRNEQKILWVTRGHLPWGTHIIKSCQLGNLFEVSFCPSDEHFTADQEVHGANPVCVLSVCLLLGLVSLVMSKLEVFQLFLRKV